MIILHRKVILEKLESLAGCIVPGLLCFFQFVLQFSGPLFPLEQLSCAALEMIDAVLLLPQLILPELDVFLQLHAVILQLSAPARLKLDYGEGENR